MVAKTEIVIVFPVDRGGRSLRNVGSYLRVITVCNPYDHDLQNIVFSSVATLTINTHIYELINNVYTLFHGYCYDKIHLHIVWQLFFFICL
jgi:hypothetical protein